MTIETDQGDYGEDFIGILKKNKTEQVRIRFGQFKGHDFLDLRVYYSRRQDEGYRPSQRGLTINPSKIPDLIKVLQEAERQARERGMIADARSG